MVNEAALPAPAGFPANPILTWPLPDSGFAKESPGRLGSSIPGLPIPAPGKVHVWATLLDAAPGLQSDLESLLSFSERSRAERFHFEEHRHRYIVAHGWLRRLLGGYLGIPANAVQFECGAQGKPFLAASARCSNLQFNLAHCESVALLAVACGTPVGIDVERVRPLPDVGDLVNRFFSGKENSEFQPLPEDQKPLAFFNLWTRKEAWLKATGEGIAHLLAGVEVSFLPDAPAQLLGLPAKYGPLENWTVRSVSPGPGLAAAVVVARTAAQPECRRWDHNGSEFLC